MLPLRTLTVAALLALSAPLVGCGPKTPVQEETGAVNPRQAFLDGVALLKSPDKQGNIDYGGAYAKFKAAAEAKPDFAKAHYNAGWTAEQQGNVSLAETHYRQAVELDKAYDAAFYALGDALARQGKAADAAALYKVRVDANADDIKARNALMEALTAANLYDDAIQQAREILARDAKNVGAYRNLSRLYFAKGDLGMSQLCAEKAKTLAEGDAGIYNNIGVTYLVMENEAAAIEEFQTARKIDPANLEANLNLGFVALDSGDFNLARECFEAALKGTPSSLEGRKGLAVALRGLKEYETASKLYEEVIAADPRDQQSYFNAATLYEKYVKDYKKAEKVLQDFVAKNNDKGQIGPSHEVYVRIERIKESQKAEEARQAEEARKKKDAEERKKRQEEQFNQLKAKVAELKGILEKNASCEAMVAGGGIEMGAVVLEQADAVVQAGEVDMAADVMTFVDETLPMLKELAATCSGAAPAPAPAEGTPPAAPADAPPADAPPAAPAGG